MSPRIGKPRPAIRPSRNQVGPKQTHTPPRRAYSHPSQVRGAAVSGAGGLYVEDAERVIGFHPAIDGGFDNSTKQILVENMLAYTRLRKSTIHLRGFGERTTSGMLKRIAVMSVSKHDSLL